MGKSVENLVGDSYIHVWQIIYERKWNSFYFLYFFDILQINKMG